jgi:hypothetical protein
MRLITYDLTNEIAVNIMLIAKLSFSVTGYPNAGSTRMFAMKPMNIPMAMFVSDSENEPSLLCMFVPS